MRDGVKNLKRAERKRMMKRFRPGDKVTWDHAILDEYNVIEVTDRGCVLDVTDYYTKNPEHAWISATQLPDGRFTILVLFDSNMQRSGPQCRFREHGVYAGPLRHVEKTRGRIE